MYHSNRKPTQVEEPEVKWALEFVKDTAPARQLRVQLGEYNGERVLSIRQFYTSKGTDEWRPSTQGIWIRDVATIDFMLSSLTELRPEAEKFLMAGAADTETSALQAQLEALKAQLKELQGSKRQAA
jgi:hypothetical protein